VNPDGGPQRFLPGDEAMSVVRKALELKGGGQ